MKHLPAGIAAAGVVVGAVAGAGSATWLSEDPAPVIVREQPPPEPPADMPEDPDPLVQWLKQHRATQSG